MLCDIIVLYCMKKKYYYREKKYKYVEDYEQVGPRPSPARLARHTPPPSPAPPQTPRASPRFTWPCCLKSSRLLMSDIAG